LQFGVLSGTTDFTDSICPGAVIAACDSRICPSPNLDDDSAPVQYAARRGHFDTRGVRADRGLKRQTISAVTALKCNR
jgi:hypothetical protein